MNVQNILLSSIDEGQRSRSDYGNIDELVADIQEHGLYHPLVVYQKRDGDDNKDQPYLLLAGGRRLNALRRMEMEEVPAHIVDRPLSKEEIKVIELQENMIRKDMTWHEETALRKQIYDLQIAIKGHFVMKGGEKHGISTEDVAEMMGITRRQLTRDLELAEQIEKNPELKNAASKQEAVKRIEEQKEALLKEELARRQKAKMSSRGADNVRKQLMSSYILKDAFEGMADLPDKSFDLIEIDPPYAIDLQEMKRLKTSNKGIEAYNEVAQDKYIEFMDRVLTESARLLKDTGHLILWFAPEPWFEPMYQLIISKKLGCVRIPGIWDKLNGQTMQPNFYLGNAYEMFFYARGKDAMIATPGTNNTIIHAPVPPDRKIHPTERPIGVMEKLLRTFVHPGATILSPFAGSGNTILAAHNVGMNAIAFDIAQEYKEAYDYRVLTNEELKFM